MNRTESGRIDALLDELTEKVNSPRNQAKKDIPPPRFGIGIEGALGWGQLVGYDPVRYHSDPLYSFENQIREKIYHIDNFDDDSCIGTGVSASIGWYFEYTLFDMDVYYTPAGVPIIQEDHPMTRTPDLRLLKPFSFTETGQMPKAISFYEDMVEIAGDRVNVAFPAWWRGPLDLAIQLRGYSNFVLDAVERPEFLHDLMKYITDERMRWHDDYCKFLGTEIAAASLADDWLNVPFISPSIFRDFVLPRYLDLERRHGGIGGIHACGNQTELQKYMLEIKSLHGFEVSPWTDLEQTLINLPQDKSIGIGLPNTDVLLKTEAEMRPKLQWIKESCRGRSYGVSAGSLQKVHEDLDEDVERIKGFIHMAKEVLHGA